MPEEEEDSMVNRTWVSKNVFFRSAFVAIWLGRLWVSGASVHLAPLCSFVALCSLAPLCSFAICNSAGGSGSHMLNASPLHLRRECQVRACENAGL